MADSNISSGGDDFESPRQRSPRGHATVNANKCGRAHDRLAIHTGRAGPSHASYLGRSARVRRTVSSFQRVYMDAHADASDLGRR